MSKKKLNELIIAFRKDLKAMDNGTYLEPLPHPNMIVSDHVDVMIDNNVKNRKAA